MGAPVDPESPDAVSSPSPPAPQPRAPARVARGSRAGRQPQASPGLAADALASHYQHTFELTYSLWRQRNRTFLLLIAAMALAIAITVDPPFAHSLLSRWAASLLQVSGDTSIERLARSPIVAMLEGALLIPVFYLMVNLYHRSVAVLRHYAYLGLLEGELRATLGVADRAVAFTRESRFYWRVRPRAMAWVKYTYAALLGGMLVGFVAVRLWNDLSHPVSMVLVMDLAVGVATLAFYGAYVADTVRSDHAREVDLADSDRS